MSNIELGIELFSPETLLKTDTDTDNVDDTMASSSNKGLTAKEDELISMETLRESPVQWPARFPGMDEFMTMSQTPIHTPSSEYTQNLTSADRARITQLASLTPDQLIEKIKSMHDEIYQLGLRESKEMTRGKLLGIFDRMAKVKK
ncbi:PREDICTED: protein lin-52 homolog isoform X1 [Drosophila arizonae]|uniref:Protein lin-52 homolog isoform X1 n=1 Tax=Drosophila arizonae TaxID=7263 RepID=A0ABM1PA90_DROAR|nr:PREDICTED: protein lin-52 homolog isoform X1 [Drosophila arizonae]